MPVELHGIFWTIHELCALTGKSYASLSVKYRTSPDMRKIGNVLLATDDLAQEIIKAESVRIYAIHTVANKCGTSPERIFQVLSAGFPHVLDRNGKQGIRAELMDIFKAAYKRVMAKVTRWDNAVHPQKVVEIARKLAEKEDADIDS